MTEETTASPVATDEQPAILPELPAPSSNVTIPVIKSKPPQTHLNAEQRRERARKAGLARAEKAAALATQAKTDPHSFDWHHASLPEAEKFLAELREEVTRGSGILQQRYGQRDQQGVKCIVCQGNIPPGKWAMSKSVRNQATGLLEAIYYCTANCVARENLRIQGIRNVPQ